MNDRRPLDITESGELRRLIQAALNTRDAALATRDAALTAEGALMDWLRDHTDRSDRAESPVVTNGHSVPRADVAKPDRLLNAVMRTSAAIATGALPARPSAEAIRHYLHIAPALAREVRETIRRIDGRP